MLITGALAMVYPLVWMVLSSFKSDQEIFSNPAALPTRLDLDNYIQGWTAAKPSFTRYFLNSFAICLGAVIGNVFACSLVAFAFARLRVSAEGRAVHHHAADADAAVACPAHSAIRPLSSASTG